MSRPWPVASLISAVALAAFLLACGAEESVAPSANGSASHEAGAHEHSQAPEAGAHAGVVTLTEAWVTLSPTGRGPAGGFLSVHNGTHREVRIVGASSTAAETVEVHRSWMENGVARMAPVTEIVIAPGEGVSLAPGGYHLMLHDVGPIEVGSTVPLVLEFSDGEAHAVVAKVQATGGGEASGHVHAH